MSSAAVTDERQIALLGNPNCGKTALFNLLTGARQKVANYAGVTVERKEGRFVSPGGRRYRVLDLPGAYSLNADGADEAITRDAVLGRLADEALPEALVCVTDATNLKLNLRLVLELKALGLPMVIALNMSDLAQRRGIRIDQRALQAALGVPVVATVAVKRGGADALMATLDLLPRVVPNAPAWEPPTLAQITATHRRVRDILSDCVSEPPIDTRIDERLDRVVMHPWLGLLILAAVLFFMFQAVFAWAEAPMGWIEAGVAWFGERLGSWLSEGPLRSLLVDGVIAGVGSVLVFLPQIVILFAFILALEDSGYLPRAAFLLDRAMGKVGLSGRSFIPLLSSFACAIPGIMATRVIGHWRDRLTTIMIAPLMTCSARLPVYALLIGAFIPRREIAGVFNLQGIVLFALYLAGIVAAMAVAFIAKRWQAGSTHHPLLLELPTWRWPSPRNLLIGIVERALIFLRRVGGIILAMMIVIWALSSYPAPPPGASGAAIDYSFAGRIGHAIQPLFAPIGFGWDISIALIPGMAAREVAVGALGTVHALGAGEGVEAQLAPLIAAQWSLATALSLLAWFVFAPQCLSTLAIVKRETQSWRYPLLMAGYLFALAYGAAFVTYRVALALGAG
jgi:ferrous iron transport protein B